LVWVFTAEENRLDGREFELNPRMKSGEAGLARWLGKLLCFFSARLERKGGGIIERSGEGLNRGAVSRIEKELERGRNVVLVAQKFYGARHIVGLVELLLLFITDWRRVLPQGVVSLTMQVSINFYWPAPCESEHGDKGTERLRVFLRD
jgi:hypothetical protein